MQVDRLIITARAQRLTGVLTSEAILAGLADGRCGDAESILVTTGKVGAGAAYIQAAEALQQQGLVGLIAPAFSWPFFRVCLTLGLPPLTLWGAGEIRTGDRLRIDVNNRVVKAMSAGTRYPIRDLSELHIEMLACGGMEGYVRARLAEQQMATSS